VTRISSRFTTFHKRIFPAVPLVGGATTLVLDLVMNGMRDFTGAIALVFFMGIISVSIGFRMWDLVDEVYDCYDHLLVNNHGLEEAIPLSSVMNVSESASPSYRRITLRLAEPCALGREIAFWPATEFSLNPFSRSSFVDELIDRVDRARVSRKAQGGAR
jgi:hypothetical protein